MLDLSALSPEIVQAAAAVLAEDPVLSQWAELQEQGWYTFKPRPDNPAMFDQQHSFCYNRDPVAFLVGGNAAGTTEAAAFKIAQFVLIQQPPPRKDTPFWIISDTYQQVCATIWQEKLLGHGHIPACEVDWKRIRWYSSKSDWPLEVPLLPWPDLPDKNWKLEFKSYGQGRSAMQARSIGGFCFSEQFPFELFIEVLRGCREYMFPGGQFAEFTPIEPELCLAIEKIMEDEKLARAGWKFYRANTQENKKNLAVGWFEQFFATVPDEMLQVRMTGALATFEGVIFQSFNPIIHIVGDDVISPEFVPAAEHFRGCDWGASMEHPQTCVWGYRDGVGDWHVYDEYWCADQGRILMDHATEIVARSLCWGWPKPDFFEDPKGWQVDFKKQIILRAKEIAAGKKIIYRHDQQHRDTFADPSRPGEINAFNQYGIMTSSAANNVLKGIDCVRSFLKINPFSSKPRLFIHKRCSHLIDEIRKYRWTRGRKAGAGSVLNPKVALPVPLKRDDDTVDALRYMIYTAERSRDVEPGTGDYRGDDHAGHSVQLQKTRALAGLSSNGDGNGAGGWFHKQGGR